MKWEGEQEEGGREGGGAHLEAHWQEWLEVLSVSLLIHLNDEADKGLDGSNLARDRAVIQHALLQHAVDLG